MTDFTIFNAEHSTQKYITSPFISKKTKKKGQAQIDKQDTLATQSTKDT
jgi:hypothetical protein